MKAKLIGASTYKGVKSFLGPVVGFGRDEALSEGWAGDTRSIKEVDAVLAACDLDREAISAQTLALEIDSIEPIDRMLAATEIRRNAVLREIDRRRAAAAQRFRPVATDIEGAEFEEVRDHPDEASRHEQRRALEANRQNAKRSTGLGRDGARPPVGRNALQQGLSLPVGNEPLLSARAEALAQAIAGSGANSKRLEAARRIAEAEIDLLRVRQARCQLVRAALENPDYEPEREIKARTGRMNRLLLKVLDAEVKEAEGKVAPANTVGNFLG